MITNHLNAGYPVIAVDTFDDSVILAELKQTSRPVWQYSASSRLIDPDGNNQPGIPWQQAFAEVASYEDAVLLCRDANHFIGNPPIYRGLLDALPLAKTNGVTIILAAPGLGTLPAELQHVAPVIRIALPDREALAAPLGVVAESVNLELNGNQDALLDAAAGLTIAEAENAYALSVVECGQLDPAIVQREKMRTLAATGYLNVEQPRSMESIGGLGQFKDYLASEVVPNCRDLDLQVRGVVLAGLPGTGKSQLARCAGSGLQWPVIRLDVGACKGGIVGQSEANIRNATAIIEAVAPCVLFIDEVEKALGGYRSSAETDGGTTLGMVGHLLTWLQDHRKPIFTIVTCNDYKALPDAFTRAGRFDERFVVDLPSQSEREAIATVHLNRLDCTTDVADLIAGKTDGYTGAEIEQLVKSAARLSGRAPTGEHIATAARSIKPLSVVNRQSVNEFREWSKGALRPANDAAQQPANTRRVRPAEAN